MKKVILKCINLILASAVLMFTSCEIGLGSAVDTELPTITLTQPSADSIVYDEFVMAGTWSDDLSIKSVTIQFKDVNDNTKIYGEYEAQITGTETEGQWTCVIDPRKIEFDIPDGSYVATATAYDNAEHSAIATTTFSIDNTAPLIVLESPTTTSIDKPNAYGQSFTVTGKAADDSDVDSIDFIFYDINGVELHRTNIKGVGTQLEVTVANWGDEVYDKIYGTDKEAGTKAYYVGLIAYDGARKVPEVEGDKGNASTSFYLWDQLESEIGTIKTSVGYKVMNGRSAVTEDEKAKWRAALDKLKIEKATFSLNPVNNPYFEVSRFEGFKAGEGNLDGNEFTNKNTLVLNIYRGRDNKAIIEDTIGVYLRECDKAGNLITDAQPIVLLQPYCDKNRNVYKDANGNPLIDQTAHSNAISSLDSSYTSTFSVNNEVYTGLVFNKYYLIDVVAYDLNGSDIRTDLKYGFKMVTTATPPVITVTSPVSGGNIPNSKAFTVTGFAKTQEDGVSVAVYNEEAKGTPFASSGAKTVTVGAYDKETLSFPFSFTVDTSAKTAGDDLPKIVIEVTSSSGLVTTQEVKIDPVLPVIGECSVAPTVDVTGADGKVTAYVNGTVTVKQSLSDNQMIKSAQYSLDDGATWLPEKPTATNMLSFDVDTTKYTDKAAKVIKVKVEDTAGNVNTGSITLNVDQSTDAPKVSLTNADMTITQLSQISTAANLFGTVTNNQLLGSVSDDDGISKVFVTVKNKETGALYTYAEGSDSDKYTKGLDVGGKTTHNISFNLPNVEGLYELSVKVVDSKQDTTGYNFVETAAFLTAVDNGAPNLTISTTNKAYQAPNSSFTLAGTTNDTSAKIGLYKDQACTIPLTDSSTAIAVSPEGLWSYVITTGAEGSNFFVRAEDKYGQYSIEQFIYMIDAQSPIFTVTQVGVGDDADIRDNKDEDETNDEHDNDNLTTITKFASANSLYTVRGKVKDFGPSGLADNLYYLVSDTEPAKAGDGASAYYVINTINGWKPAIISKNSDSDKLSSWVANIDLGEKNEDGSRKFAEGSTYNLYLAVKDSANNTSLINANKASNAIKFTLDSNKPYIDSMGLVDEGANSYVYVITKDVESGISKTTLVLNSVEQNVEPVSVVNAEDPTGKDPKNVLKKYSFLVDLSSISNSTDIKYTILVKDNAGNSDSKPVQSIDNTSPSIDFGDWYSSLYRKGDYYYTNKNIVIPYTVKATNNGISSIKYNENNSGDNSEYTKTAADASFPTTKTGTITITKPASSKKVDNVFTATNKYNNSNAQTLKYVFDLDDPTITLNSNTTVKTGIDNFFNATKVLLIEGTAADASNATAELNSGISEIKYSLVSGDVDTAGTWDDVQGTLNWKLKLDLTADTYAEGRYTLFFKSIDNVGNESATTKVKLIADKKEPEFKITSTTVKTVTTPASALASFYPDTVIIKGTLEDSYLSDYTVTVNGTAGNFDTGFIPVIYSDTPLTSQNWQLTLDKSETEYTIVITAKDKVGNAIPVATLNTSIDIQPPKFTITEVNGEKTATNLPPNSREYATYGNLSSFFKITGEVTDTGNSGLGSYMYYKVVESNTAPTTINLEETGWETVSIDPQTNKNVWTINANFGAVQNLANGDDCYILLAVKDNAGNVSTIADNPANKIKVTIDGIAPVVDVQPAISYDSANDKNIITFAVHDADSGVASFALKNKRTGVTKSFTPATIAKGTTATTVKCEISASDLTATENNFTIVVTDYAGNEETTDSVTVSKSAADLTISAPDAQYVNGGYNYYNKGFTISGSYTVPAGNALKSLTVNGAAPTTIDLATKTFTYNIGATDTGKSTVTIKTTTSFGETQTKTYNYVVDTTVPTFTITKIDGKTETAATLYSTYGKLANYFVIEGSTSDAKTGVQDSGVGNYLYYKMVKGSTAPDKDATNTAIYKDVTSWDKTNITKSNGNWIADLNFNNVSGLTNGDDCYIYFATVDNVGNVSTIAGNPSNKIKVRIDGVAPVFEAAPTVALGGTGTEDKAVISVKAKDEHSSLADADVKLVRGGTLLAVSPTASATADASGYKTYSFTLTSANLVDGLNNFTIEATDAAGNKGTSSSVTIDNSAPDITTSHSLSYVDAEGYYYSNKDFDINSTVTVTAGQNKLASVTGATLVSGNNYKQTISGTTSTGQETYTVTATSIFGKSTTKTVKYVIDATAPTFVLSNYTGYEGTPTAGTSAITDNVTTFGNTESYFTIEGSIADATASGNVASGYVTNVYYNVAKTEPTKKENVYDITATGWKSTPLQAGGSFSLPLKFSDFGASENDTFTIYLAAKDNAGNVSAPATYKLSVKIDGTKPTVGTPVLTLGNSYAADSYTTIVVPASDGGSGIDVNSAVITLNDEAYTKAAKTFANGEYTFSIKNTDAGLVEGKNVFVVTVTDKAGNYKSSEQIIINNDAPVITSSASNASNYKSGDAVYSNEQFTITGNVTVSGNNKISVTSWNDGTKNASNKIIENAITLGTGGAYTITINPKAAGETRTNTITNTITATNVFGVSSTKSLKYIFDTTAPVFTLSAIKGEAGTVNKDSTVVEKYGNVTDPFKVKGSVTETGSGIGSYIYYKVDTTAPASTNGIYNGVSDWSTSAIKNNGFEIPVSFEGLTEGTDYYIYLATIDNVGNISTIADNPSNKIKVTIDSKAPVYKDPSLSYDETNNQTVLKFPVKDEVSGIGSNTIYLNGEAYTKVVTGYPTTAAGTGTEDGYTIYEYRFANNDSGLEAGANKFKVTFTDNNNNSSTTKEITINNDAPVLSGLKISNSADKNRDAERDDYVLENSDFNITGKVTVSDYNKLLNVTWKDTFDGNSDANAKECAAADLIKTTGNFTVSVAAGTATYGAYEGLYVERTFTATNIYGRVSTATVYFKRDTTAPAIVLSDVGTVKGLTIGGKLTTELDDWLNSTTLSISGSYIDNGSGIEKVTYYWTSEGDGGNIFTSGSTKISNTVYYPYSGTVGGFTEKHDNVIHFTVTDRAGNKFTSDSYTVKVDITTPKISALKFGLESDLSDAKSADSAILTNRSADIILSGSFSDAVTGKTVSGVESLVVKINSVQVSKADGVTITPAVADNYTSGTWTAVIDKSKLSETDGTYQAVVEITDKAGNTDKSTSCSIKVDNQAPTTKIEAPSTTATLNGKNTFSGKVTENNNPKSIELRYVFSTMEKTAADLNALSKWPADKFIGKKTVGDTGIDIGAVSSWKFENIDVNSYLPSGSSAGYLYILPVAYDEAGNCSISGTIAERTGAAEGWSKFSVDLDSDRPTIKFTNLGKAQAYLKNTSTLTGSVTDDDGVAVLKISNSTNEPDWSTITAEPDPSTINFNLGDDGLKTLWFYIEDTAGGIFKTSSTRLTSPLSTPKLIFNSKTAGVTDTGDNTASISFTTDSNAPAITSTKFGYGDTVANAIIATPAEFAATGNKAGGPKRKFVTFAVSVSDSSGIASVKAELDGTEYELKESSTAGTYIYMTGTPAAASAVDVSGISVSGTKTVTFTVTDNAGLETQINKSLIVDNGKPTAELISPTDEVYGAITLKGTASDEFTSIETVKYLIPSDTNYTGSTLNIPGTGDFTAVSVVRSGTPSSWAFKLDGAADSNPALPVTETALENYTKIPYTNNIYTFPVFIYVEDEVGNADVIQTSITYNPFGNRPVTTIAYPTSKYAAADTPATDKPNFITGYENVNGSIRISGAATCNTTLSGGAVYIQIDANRDGKFDDADVTTLASAGYTIVEDITTGSTADNKAALTYASESTWGILVNGTNNWNFTLNSNAELKLDSAKVSDGKYKLGVRAITKSAAGMFGSWSDSAYFMIDINAPQIGTASLVASTDSTVARTYVEDMYLRGTQYLKLSITDKTGLSKITYSYAKDIATVASAPKATVTVDLKSLTNGGTAADGTIASWTAATATSDAVYTVYIPVSTLPSKIAAGNKAVSLKVTAYKDSESESTDYQRYSMSFDNIAPEITYVKFNGDDGDTTPGTMANRIVNSNGTYFTLGGKVKDEDSGFDKLAFYYYRDKQDNEGQKRRVYDPMKAPEGNTYKSAVQVTADDASTSLVSGITKVDITAGEKSVPLYGYTKSATVKESGSKIELGTALTTADHIRVGGLVQINSIWHTISAIAADNKTITLSTATTATGSVSAFFPIAQVIDNTGSEKTQANGDFIPSDSGDDGDGMAESIIKSGTYWTLDATIHSNYIPDGPGTLVAVLWDKAGNVEVQEYTASVQNNAPRLTKLWLGTSLSSSFDESNFTEYDVLAKAGEQRSYTMETASFNSKKRFRVKGDLAVVTEFVGGNNASGSTNGSRIKMVYNNNASAETAGYVTADATSSNVYTRDETLSAEDWFAPSTGYNAGELENFAFKIPKEKLGDDSSYAEATGYAKRSMSFTFWDDTDETTQCKNSCYSYLKITDLIVMLDDNFAPTVAIDPFYWKSPEDNSLVGFSYKNGHIDLPTVEGAKLDTETGLFKHADSGLVAGNATNKPQVSGKVSLRGTALDEHTLNSIWVAFTDKTATPVSVITPDESSYLATEGIYYKVAQKDTTNGEWTKASGTTWQFYIEKDESTQEGQVITWRLDVDTSKMDGSMGTNKVFRVMARDDAYGKTGKKDADHQSGTTASGTLGRDGKYDLLIEGTNHPSYVVDVVPYISDVYTDTNTAANRSRLGRYSVQAGATVYLKGFNFGAGTVTATRHKTASGKAASDFAGEITATRTDANTIKITAPAYSGFVNVSIKPTSESAVAVSNNTNENTAYNIQEGYLASEATTYGANAAATAGKNFWTDDVYLSVWRNTARTGSVNPWDGTVRKLKTSESKSGKFYANKSGSAVDEMSNSLDTWFGAWSSPNMMIYDEAGNGDFANKRTLYNNSQAAFVTPVETMDMAIIGGIPWYVFNDNYVGGNSANSWGAGLILAREGYNFPKGDFNSTSSPTPQEFVNIIERQGAGTAADSRDSSGGYDSVLHQFKNPKVSGWYDNTPVTVNNGNGSVNYDGTNYIYVSYYDSFSHCLKYAAFSEAWSKDGVGSKWGNLNGTKNFKDLARSATSMATPKTVVAGVDRMYTAYDFSTDNGEEAGEWSDIMVDPSDHKPVIIYYNKTQGSLEVAHGKTIAPETANYKSATGAFVDTTEGTTGWTKTKSINPIEGHDFGRYVSAEMDKNGNIHATAQDFTTGALWYVFLKKNGTSYTSTYQIVDAEISAGIWTDIQLDNDVATNTTWAQYRPVISYIDQSKKLPKVAYVETSGTGENDVNYFEAVSDANNYEAKDMKTSVMTSVYEEKQSGIKDKASVAFNSDMLCIDFLRDEQ